MQKYILLVIFILGYFVSNAQREKGTWQDYLSYANASKVALSSERVYCVSEGGLFYYNLEDNSVNKFSGIIALSDFGIKTIAYNEDNNVLIVAYSNSNIDLVYDNGNVFNLSDIKRKQITGDKAIYNITFSDGEAYLACGFGIVVLNLARQEVKDTYFIGENGASLRVNDVETDSRYIYAATAEGLFRADKSSSNLLDFNNWEKDITIPESGGNFNHLAIHDGNLLVAFDDDGYGNDKIYMLSGNNWAPYLPQIDNVRELTANEGYLLVTSWAEVYVIDYSHSILGMLNYYQFENEKVTSIEPRSAGVTADGSVWIADYENALVKINGVNFELASPNGPFDNNMFSLHQFDTELWVAPGGKTGWEQPRFQRFDGSEWKYFTKITHPELDGFFNIISIEVDPSDPNHVFAASWGGGLLEFKNEEFVARYTHNNSKLQTILPPDTDEHYIRIGGMDFDSKGNLWMTNSEVAENLAKLSPDGSWETFALPQVANDYSIGELIVNQDNDKWIVIPRGHDAYVVDESGNQIKRLLVTAYFNNGEYEEYKRMNDIYSIAEDNEGAIWIGTSMGVAVYNTPHRIWDVEELYATRPSLDLNDGLFHPLLESETVTAIVVDGANRKWIGTSQSGVYLISEDGEEELLHFTTENSALLSNSIISIAINPKSGEVFFGTEKGLISYMGDATGGSDVYEDVYVYPNPVRETYDGPVTIAGLIENSDVKITDISGNLVYQTTSLGGQAIWDGKNFNGNRVKTGVYLVFCNDETGEETHITKILFIH